MTDQQQPDPEIELDGILGAYTFLLELLFVMILERDPDGLQPAFQRTEEMVRGILQRSVAVAAPTTSRDVELSAETERQLKIFLARLALRIGA
jgi:hypothetical protein